MLHSDNLFPKLIQSLRLNNLSQVKQLLTPDMLAKVDSSGKNLLHYVARYANKEMMEYVTQYVEKLNKSELLLKPDRRGYTPLHEAVSQNTAAGVESFLRALRENADIASKKITNRNKMPIDLIQDNENKNDREAIIKLLLPLMQQHRIRPLSEKIDSDAVLARYPEYKSDPEFKKILHACCEFINAARDIILKSDTHPNNGDQSNAADLINAMRHDLNKQRELIEEKYIQESLSREIKMTPDDIKKEIELEKQKKTALLNNSVSFYLKVKKGRCGEFAEIITKLFNDYFPELHVEEFVIERSDHEFTVINRDPLSDPCDYKTWGGKTFICDGWSGEVFLAREIPERLTYYRSNFSPPQKIYESANGIKSFDIIGSLNPDYHVIDQQFSTWTTLEILNGLTQAQQKKYLLIKDFFSKTPLHQAVRDNTFCTLQIIFKMIDDLNDDEWTKKLFLAKDSKKNTPIHLVGSHADPRVLKLFLQAYAKQFGAKLPEILFGDLFHDTDFFEFACLAKRTHAILTLFDFFQHDHVVIERMQELIRSLFNKFIDSDDSKVLDGLDTLLKCPKLIPTELLKQAFCQIPLYRRTMQKLLWNEIQSRCGEEEQMELLAKHPEYQNYFYEFKKLKKLKAEMTQPLAGQGMFKKSETSSSKVIKEILKELPDKIFLNENMMLNISLAKLKKMHNDIFNTPADMSEKSIKLGL